MRSLISPAGKYRSRVNDAEDEYGLGKRIELFHNLNGNSLKIVLNKEEKIVGYIQ